MVVLALTGGGLALLLAAVLVINTLGHVAKRSASSQVFGPGSETVHPDRTSLGRRASAAGIPLLGREGAVTHTHTLVHVVVDGSPQVVPAGIGIDAADGVIAAVHTHAPDGIVHVESPQVDATYRLRQFLTLWGVGSDEQALCQHFIGGACKVRVSVVTPTAEDRAIFEYYGPMPEQASTVPKGLDTQLDQGTVIELDLTRAPAA
jgi:hypothetical protein